MAWRGQRGRTLQAVRRSGRTVRHWCCGAGCRRDKALMWAVGHCGFGRHGRKATQSNFSQTFGLAGALTRLCEPVCA